MTTLKVPYTLKTWADGFGLWHCDVTIHSSIADVAAGAEETARAAIADELLQRGNAATATYLASDAFRVELTETVRTDGDIRYRFREGNPDAPKVRRVVVEVVVEVSEADYELNYGRVDDLVEYTAETVRDAARERLALVGWGKVEGV